jgi:hypothetical protein
MLMPDSGITFVRPSGTAHHALHSHQPLEQCVMRIVELFTRLSFGVAAVAVVAGMGFTLEYEPLLSALAR